jgi:hypothetical protein
VSLAVTPVTDAQALDAIETSVRVTSPFDLSPRGVRIRPDADLTRAVDAFLQRQSAVPALADRLEAAPDALMALFWLFVLKRARTASAEAAVASYVSRAERENRWAQGYPGIREIRLFLGLR